MQEAEAFSTQLESKFLRNLWGDCFLVTILLHGVDAVQIIRARKKNDSGLKKKTKTFQFSDDTEENILKLLLEIARDNCSCVIMFGNMNLLLWPVVKCWLWVCLGPAPDSHRLQVQDTQPLFPCSSDLWVAESNMGRDAWINFAHTLCTRDPWLEQGIPPNTKANWGLFSWYSLSVVFFLAVRSNSGKKTVLITSSFCHGQLVCMFCFGAKLAFPKVNPLET